MKYNRFSQVFALIVFIGAVSCDPGFDYKRRIVNASDHDIRVIQTIKECTAPYRVKDTVFINRNSSGVIGEDGGLGTLTGYEGCISCSDSIEVRVTDDTLLSLTLDLADSKNWKFTRLTKTFKNGGKAECTVFISNKDFQ